MFTSRTVRSANWPRPHRRIGPGPARCRTLYRCETCDEPFEVFSRG
ncbi:PaaD-like zinc ribbon domain-containing protein [Natrinema salifodinae]